MFLLGFWDPSEAKPYDVSQFRVAVGKEKLGFDAIENQKEQKFEVERIFYEPGYNHATGNYASDIVLIVLKNTIEFKSYITPICIPYGLTYDDRVVPAGWKGRVAGWGKTSSGGLVNNIINIRCLLIFVLLITTTLYFYFVCIQLFYSGYKIKKVHPVIS